MPAAGQRDTGGARSELRRHRHGADPVDEDLRRRLWRLHVEVMRPGFDPPQAAPPYGEFQLSPPRLSAPIEIETAVVVEEGEWKLRAAGREVESIVDACECAVGVLSAALVRTARGRIGEVTRAKAAGAGNQRRCGDSHRQHGAHDPRARQPRGPRRPRRGSRAGVEPTAIGGQPRDHQQRNRIEWPERNALDQSARIRRHDKVRGPDQQTGRSASSGNTHRVQNGMSMPF